MGKYDVIIVGSGPAGIFAAYEFTLAAPDKKVLLVDKGHNIYDRTCPIMEGKITQCVRNGQTAMCKPTCSITGGFGGSGAFSDGKFNITSEFGGWLTEYRPVPEVIKLIRYVDDINLKHGATTTITNPSTEAIRHIEKKAFGAGLKLLRAEVRHLGTEANLEILKSIYVYLKDRIEMVFQTEVKDIIAFDDGESLTFKGVELADSSTHFADYAILCPGRDGAAWLTQIMTTRGLPMHSNQVDVGVRVETSDVVMYDINKHLYEGKFIFNTSVGTQVRTFCSNPSGHVVIENHSGIMSANGHSYKDPNLGSGNTNFALLVSHKFTDPFNKPNEYARAICKTANDLTDGRVIIQKLGDLVAGRRSTAKRIKEGFIEPTLKEAVPGDLSLALPYKTMVSIIEMVRALDKVTPGIDSEHTLFYGVEAKFYSARPNLTSELESQVRGLFCGGDGAGVTRGLAQASAAGVMMARSIISRLS